MKELTIQQKLSGYQYIDSLTQAQVALEADRAHTLNEYKKGVKILALEIEKARSYLSTEQGQAQQAMLNLSETLPWEHKAIGLQRLIADPTLENIPRNLNG